MTTKSGPPPIVYIVIVLALLGAGYWYFVKRPNPATAPTGQIAPTAGSNSAPVAPQSAPAPDPSFSPPATVPSGTNIRINGSTSMVEINQRLKQGFEQQYPGTTVTTNATGSDLGIEELMAGRIDIAASSRPLTSQEQDQGLVAVPSIKDAITVVVGDRNPFRKGLTQEQVEKIFKGQITNWSEVSGSQSPIRVINRPPESGTRQIFQKLVLEEGKFGSSSNFTTLPRDATTPMLQALNQDGIGYATYSQVADQRTVRAVGVDGLTPEAENYPYQRTLYYIYKQPPTEAVKAFLGYASSMPGN